MTPEQSELLKKILENAKRMSGSGAPVTAVFDLDSTLFEVNPRTLTILRNFVNEKEFQDRFPEPVKKLRGVQNLLATYHIKEQLTHLGLTQETKEFYKSIYEYWRSHFFSDAYLIHDEPYPGAKEFVLELHQLGVEIIYLTGRDIPRMRIGTLQSLVESGFPSETEGAKLVMKPHSSLDDAEFKKDYFSTLNRDHASVWFFENEPANINLVHKFYPQINIVYFDSVHSGKEEVPDFRFPKIKSFIY